MEKSQRLVLVLLLFVTVGVATEGADYLKYKDPNQPLVVRLNDLISRMTLEEKIGQMAQIDRSNASSDVLKNYFIGSVLYEAVSSPGPQASPKVWVDQVNEMQRAALSTRLGIPIIIGIDAIHGHNTVYNATIFPHNIGLGATRDPALVRKIGAATALEVRATGIPYTFAPCIAVCRDPRWGRCYESYSEDPKIVEMMTEIIPGLQGEIPQNSLKGVPFVAAGKTKVAACAKHYVGDGGTQLGIDENNTIVNFHGLLSIHMPPFYHAIIKGVSTVMVSYSSWNGVKMHANHYLLTDFLKNKLRFRIMIPFNYPQYNESFIDLVNKGIIPMSRIDDAVRRILRVKFQMGLFENPLGDYSMTSEIGKQEHRDLAREAVRKSLVLLKNGKIHGEPLLPLPKKAKKILVAGSSADNLGYQCGGWTIQWQGVSGNNLTIGTTLLEAIRTTVDVSTEVVYSENPDESFIQSNEFSYAIVAVGEHPYAEYFGDSSNLTIADNGPLTIQNVCKHVKCVVIVISGRPVVIEPYVNEIDALVAAWLPGTEGHGMTDALFGDYGFTGKLSKTWFKSVDQLPMNVGDAHYDPLYPFGFGLTTEPLKTTY